jgi:hypothetical protein
MLHYDYIKLVIRFTRYANLLNWGLFSQVMKGYDCIKYDIGSLLSE